MALRSRIEGKNDQQTSSDIAASRLHYAIYGWTSKLRRFSASGRPQRACISAGQNSFEELIYNERLGQASDQWRSRARAGQWQRTGYSPLSLASRVTGAEAPAC